MLKKFCVDDLNHIILMAKKILHKKYFCTKISRSTVYHKEQNFGMGKFWRNRSSILVINKVIKFCNKLATAAENIHIHSKAQNTSKKKLANGQNCQYFPVPKYCSVRCMAWRCHKLEDMTCVDDRA